MNDVGCEVFDDFVQLMLRSTRPKHGRGGVELLSKAPGCVKIRNGCVVGPNVVKQHRIGRPKTHLNCRKGAKAFTSSEHVTLGPAFGPAELAYVENPHGAKRPAGERGMSGRSTEGRPTMTNS